MLSTGVFPRLQMALSLSKTKSLRRKLIQLEVWVNKLSSSNRPNTMVFTCSSWPTVSKEVLLTCGRLKTLSLSLFQRLFSSNHLQMRATQTETLAIWAIVWHKNYCSTFERTVRAISYLESRLLDTPLVAWSWEQHYPTSKNWKINSMASSVYAHLISDICIRRASYFQQACG